MPATVSLNAALLLSLASIPLRLIMRKEVPESIQYLLGAFDHRSTITMLQDGVPNSYLHLTAKKHCSTVEEYENPLPTARFTAHPDGKRSSTILRKGFLTSSAAKPATKVSRCFGPSFLPTSELASYIP